MKTTKTRTTIRASRRAPNERVHDSATNQITTTTSSRCRCSFTSFAPSFTVAVAVAVLLTIAVIPLFRLALFGERLDWRSTAAVPAQVNVKARLSSSSSPITYASNTLKFYVLHLPELTTQLVRDKDNAAVEMEARDFYGHALNEEQAEMWLHRGFTEDPRIASSRTSNPQDADVVIVCAYLHLLHHLQGSRLADTTKTWIDVLSSRLVPNKTHVVAVPTWNPERSRKIGLNRVHRVLREHSSHLAEYVSFGFERNPYWQPHTPVEDIIPIPYVLKVWTDHQYQQQQQQQHQQSNPRPILNSIFYAGDVRKHAPAWAGCNRTHLVRDLVHSDDSKNNTNKKLSTSTTTTSINVRLFHQSSINVDNRYTQDEYNRYMASTNYCLILCGDTPTSRSLTSAMWNGCVPIFVGSRWRGRCDAPCREGWGWTVTTTGNNATVSHRPFEGIVNWTRFPEVDEAAFADDALSVLNRDVFGRYSPQHIRATMMKPHRHAWVYGFGGNPALNGTELGDATLYAWRSLQMYLAEKNK
jgi:Exostosin family